MNYRRGHFDHHSVYLTEALAALTPDGHRRVDELLEQLSAAVTNREWLIRFAGARREEADTGRVDPAQDAAIDAMLSPARSTRCTPVSRRSATPSSWTTWPTGRTPCWRSSKTPRRTDRADL